MRVKDGGWRLAVSSHHKRAAAPQGQRLYQWYPCGSDLSRVAKPTMRKLFSRSLEVGALWPVPDDARRRFLLNGHEAYVWDITGHWE